MIINSARFVVSNPTVGKCPADTRHEYAFIGRSNVGKSSLINMLAGNRSLAKTSSTPGKTMLINHFLVNDSWYIVDLPGYGFAQRGKSQREQLEKMIRGYILNRAQMTNLFVLIDSRHKPMKIDLKFFNWLGETECLLPSCLQNSINSARRPAKGMWRNTAAFCWKHGKNCRRCS